MALVRFALNSEVDLASGDELAAGLSDVKDSILKKLPSPDRGVRKRVFASIPASAAGNYVLDFGSPAPGCIWWIQEVDLFGSDDRTPLTVTGQASVTVTPAPAAGAESITTVPAGEQWTLQSWTATLVTSATVANRQPVLIVDDGAGHTIWTSSQAAAQTAAQTVTYQGTQGVPAAALANGIVQLTFPSGLVLQGGWRIRTLTTGIVAGDQWSAANVAYLRTTGGQTGAVTGALYAGPPPAPPGALVAPNNAPLLGTLIRPAITVPGVHGFSGEAIAVLDSENLYEMVYATVAFAGVGGTATVVEMDSRAVVISQLG